MGSVHDGLGEVYKHYVVHVGVKNYLKDRLGWFGLVWFRLLGLIASQQQPGSLYRGGDDDEMTVSLVEETGVPGGNHRTMASNG